ncbi:MAG: hypothetical protein OXH92_01690 [Bryobacterales bacterium]|nr:hypothetical protein [Bryobacterales bacterium]MDE0294015.1 hypothetical protein [Bryobacterales bacterium]MDE0432697.1 hypothetical protein [Bryobacterales bacterium]
MLQIRVLLDLKTEGGTVYQSLVQAFGQLRVWLDMEYSHYVDPTLDLYRAIRDDHPMSGICLQSYLYRTPTDLHRISGPADEGCLRRASGGRAAGQGGR